eukprot:gene11028-biopygen9381
MIDEHAPEDTCGFTEDFGPRPASDKVHANIDIKRMRLSAALLMTFDVRHAFPSLDLLVALFGYHLIGMPERWLRARARLWGVVGWDFEIGSLDFDPLLQPRLMLAIPGTLPREVRQFRGAPEGTKGGPIDWKVGNFPHSRSVAASLGDRLEDMTTVCDDSLMMADPQHGDALADVATQER